MGQPPGGKLSIPAQISNAFWSTVERIRQTKDTYEATHKAEMRHGIDIGEHEHMGPHPPMKTRHVRVMKMKK
jgi:hypothetical protein